MSTGKPKTIYENFGDGLHLRSYIRDEEGAEPYSEVWVWRTVWDRKRRELAFAPKAVMPEAGARALADASNLRKRAGWSFDEIRDAFHDLLVQIADARLAGELEEADLLPNPFAQGHAEFRARQQHKDLRGWTDAALGQEEAA